MDEERKLELDEELKGFINTSAGPSEAKKIKSEQDLEARVLAYVYANETGLCRVENFALDIADFGRGLEAFFRSLNIITRLIN